MSFQESPNNWQPPDGLGYSSLRPVRLTAQGYALAALGVILSIAGPVMGTLVFNQSNRAAREQRLIDGQGVDATAVITRKWRTGDKDTTHMVAYRFAAGERQVEGRCTAPSRIWDRLETGADLPVRFVAGRPEINHPSEWKATGPPFWVAGFVTVAMWFPATMLAWMIRKQSRLLSEGRPAPGTVTRLRRTDKAVIVYYDFTLLSGAAMKGRSSGGRRQPGVGSSVCVLYDPDNPLRNAVYPLPLVKLMRS